MSDYPSTFNNISKYLFAATDLAGMKEPLALCASYFCRTCWVKKASDIYQQQPNPSVFIL